MLGSTPLPSLDQVLVIKPGIRVEAMDAESVFLIGERQRYLLSDSHTVGLISLIDGRRTVDDILREASVRISEAKSLYILGQLMERGYVVESAPELAAQGAAHWYGLGLDAKAVAETLERTPVSVRSLAAPELGRSMADALGHAGVRVEDASPVQVVVTDDPLRPELASINAAALERKALWFLVQPVGTTPLIGPTFRPAASPCWECLAFFLRNNRPVEELVRRRNGASQVWPPQAALEASVRTACGLAALAVARELASENPVLSSAWRSQILALDVGSLQTTMHAVVRRPQCPACGKPACTAALGERPIELEPVPKGHSSDGGYRRAAPRDTWERFSHLISPVSGPVAYVVPMPGRNTEIRAAYASGYLACPRAGIPRNNSFDKMCAGKGRSADQARASALCEALERFSGVYQGDEARLRANMTELGDDAVSPESLTNFSESQYRIRAESLAGSRDRAPERLGPDTAIDWSPAWSLSRAKRRYVPLTYCYAEAPVESGSTHAEPCGNGVAAGTCVEEAVLQGLLELVERDAAAVWWYNRVARPGVDFESFGNAYFGDLLAEYARLGWKVWALDLTHDLGIATFVALAHEPNEDRFSIGFGCHLDPELALQRALTELNQLFEPTAKRRAPWDIERVSDREYLFPHRGLPRVRAADLPRIDEPDLRADIERCLERLHAVGLEVLVVNKTRPDIELSVAQVIVPGLRHFWPRFGPGRLYGVPHALGWLREPLAEASLNPVPLFV